MDKAALRASARDFRDQVWPLVREHLGGGDLEPVESVTDSRFATHLDTLGMTDAWQVVSPLGLRGLATRIQWRDSSGVFPTWTVRYELPSGQPTEYHKLIADGEWHRPSFVIQAYLETRGGAVIAAACIATADLRALLLEGLHGQPLPNGRDGNLFVPVRWDIAERRGCPIWRYEAPVTAGGIA